MTDIPVSEPAVAAPQPQLQGPAPLTVEQVSGIVSDRFKDLYEFAGKQISESRTSFESFYKITLGGIGVVTVVALGLFYYLIGQQRKDINAIVSNQANAHFEDLDKELRAKITARIDDEFRTDKMQEMIRNVAREETASGLNNQFSSLRGDLESIHAELSRYVLPRTFTAKQKSDLISYLSHSQSRATVIVRADSSDGESMNFVNQILEILKASDWESQFDAAHPPTVPGLTIAADVEGQGRPMDLKHPTPDWVLNQAFVQTKLAFGGRTSMNKPSYAVYIEVGKRPWAIENPTPGRK